MSLWPVRAVLVLVLLLGWSSQAQSRSKEPPRPPLQLELPPLRGVAAVNVAPGAPTTLLFNARLDRSAVERAAHELGLTRVAVAEDTLTVVPAMGVQAGTRLRLPVRFAEGTPQEGEVVVFVVDPLNAEAHVEVTRRMRTVPALEEALAAERARSASQAAELAARDVQVAELHAAQGDLAGLIEAGTLGPEGISVQQVQTDGWYLAPGFRAGTAQLYVTAGRRALVAELHLLAGERPWAPAGATLQPVSAGTLERWNARVVRLLGTDVITPGGRALLVVEFEVPVGGLAQEYRMTVREQEGLRAFVLRVRESPPGRRGEARGGRP